MDAAPDSASPPGIPVGAPSAGEADAAPSEAVSRGFDPRTSNFGIDYRGDRAPSDFRSVGERMAGLIWHMILAVAIIAWFIYNLASCFVRNGFSSHFVYAGSKSLALG